MGLGGTISILAFAAGGLATALSAIGSLLAAIVSPVGLVIAALVGLGAYLITTTGAGAEALSWLGEKFQTLKNTALAAFQGIGDALAAGPPRPDTLLRIQYWEDQPFWGWGPA